MGCLLNWCSARVGVKKLQGAKAALEEEARKAEEKRAAILAK